MCVGPVHLYRNSLGTNGAEVTDKPANTHVVNFPGSTWMKLDFTGTMLLEKVGEVFNHSP